MFSLLSDENFNDDVVRGLLLRQPDLDIVRAQDVGLAGMEDSEILAWAADNNRILLTHDRATVPDHAYARLDSGEALPGVLILSNRFPIGLAIEEVLLLVACTKPEEWIDRVGYLPL